MTTTVYQQARSEGSRDATSPAVWRGRGRAAGHHGEILQGVFEQEGRLHRGLATLPCPMFSSCAEVELWTGAEEIVVEPAWKTKAVDGLRRAATALELGPVGGRLRISSNMQVGRGFGSSTSDVIATIYAVLDAVGGRLPTPLIAEITVAAEVASDPLMFDHALLFAHREGGVLEDFGRCLPPLEVVGCNMFEHPVDTLELPPARYSSQEIEAFRPLRARLRRAIAEGVAADVGRVATASARINQRYLPVPQFDEVLEVARCSGAVGVQVAHSGSVIGLLFDPADGHVSARIQSGAAGLRRLGVPTVWRFTTSPETWGGWT